MNEHYHSNTDLYVCLHDKYYNIIFPRLHELITTYVIENPNKKSKYLSNKIKTCDLLDYIAKRYKETKEEKLLEYTIEYVEGKK